MEAATVDEIPASTGRPGSDCSDHSLLRRFRRGSQDAATELYLRYAKRLYGLARGRVSADLAPRVDADDIVQSVFKSFFQAVGRGHYDVPAGEELWKILLVIALNKIRTQKAYHRAAKRDARLTAGGECFERTLETLQHDEAAYAFLQLATEEALDRLPPSHKQMVELRIQGHEVAQIAVLTGRSKRTVERVLQEARTRLDAIFHEPD